MCMCEYHLSTCRRKLNHQAVVWQGHNRVFDASHGGSARSRLKNYRVGKLA